ncbi:VC2046/SO_2500 family protein [Shewanella sp. UCD-KL12]|uniref:VC2046/SO_2500 family protein n=1 Tax=Shewanella sp. UCD-KL12 TaxID=1917163 RepID=UPI0009712E42|nr:VC2046/SO_2500 family protein [Shewanella sp. UCD-KL12]
MRPGSILINESQLGSRLNHAVDSERRGEFALLLSLLSTDARDMAQFQLEKGQLDEDSQLRAKFELPKAETLINDLSRESNPVNHSESFRHGGVKAFQLQQALSPEALVVRGTESAQMQKVLTNCDLITRERYQSAKALNSTNKDSIHLSDVHFVDLLSKQRQMGKLIASC